MLQQILNGLSIGSVYASLAVGFSLIYGVLEFPHFAHGITMMLAAYIGFFVASWSGNFVVTVALAMVGGGLVSIAMESAGYRVLRNKRVPKIYYLALSMGFCTFFENLTLNATGGQFFIMPKIIPSTSFTVGALTISLIDLLALVLSGVFLLIFSFIIFKTPVGLAIRSSSNNMLATQLMGVKMNFTMRFVFFLAGAAAGFAGIILGMKYTVYPQMWFITNKVFVATVLGGMGSLAGAICASLLVGLLETFFTAYISSEMSSLLVFVLLIVILMFRPQGLFGKRAEDKA